MSLTNRSVDQCAQWFPASDAPDGVVVMTKIDDDRGVRNETILRKSGRMWFSPDGRMYVYYTPTHFRFIEQSQ